MFFLIIAIGFLIYFIPSFAAYSNKKRSKDAIVALNLLGGWTGILWLVSLIWAMSKDAPVAEVKIQNTNTNIGTELEKLLLLKEKGVLTEEQFNTHKNTLLQNTNEIAPETLKEDAMVKGKGTPAVKVVVGVIILWVLISVIEAVVNVSAK
jgi:hypothetical protein